MNTSPFCFCGSPRGRGPTGWSGKLRRNDRQAGQGLFTMSHNNTSCLGLQSTSKSAGLKSHEHGFSLLYSPWVHTYRAGSRAMSMTSFMFPSSLMKQKPQDRRGLRQLGASIVAPLSVINLNCRLIVFRPEGRCDFFSWRCSPFSRAPDRVRQSDKTLLRPSPRLPRAGMAGPRRRRVGRCIWTSALAGRKANVSR